MLWLLRQIYSFGPDVAVQLDTTRDNRLNYLCGRQYGTIFVENRYTKSANAFPHRVLRNLWMLGHHLPTAKFQFELVNPDLYSECYASDDPLAPSKYDMDYLFAVVMTSNPLFWMEMQFLSEKRKKELDRIMPVWKQYRDELAECDIVPVGEKPSGRSITGFAAVWKGKLRYLIAYREITERAETVMSLPACAGGMQILASNTQAEVMAVDGGVRLRLEKPGGYAFCRIRED